MIDFQFPLGLNQIIRFPIIIVFLTGIDFQFQEELFEIIYCHLKLNFFDFLLLEVILPDVNVGCVRNASLKTIVKRISK